MHDYILLLPRMLQSNSLLTELQKVQWGTHRQTFERSIPETLPIRNIFKNSTQTVAISDLNGPFYKNGMISNDFSKCRYFFFF